MSEYQELLKKPQWQKKRLEIFNRDNWTCQMCGSTEFQLQVHHKSYVYGNKPWEYENENLTTYCCECHSLFEALRKRGGVLESSLYVKGLGSDVLISKILRNGDRDIVISTYEKGSCIGVIVLEEEGANKLLNFLSNG